MSVPAPSPAPSLKSRASRHRGYGQWLAQAARQVALLACLLLQAQQLVGCAAPQSMAQTAALPLAAEHTIYVVRHGWHTGVVFRAADLPAHSPLRAAFPQAEHVEAGWGDRDYYMAEDAGIALALRAALWPTPGALHIVGFTGSPQANFPNTDIVKLAVSRAGLQRMHDRVQDSFEIDSQGSMLALGPGLYGESRFYASQEQFHLFKTCNVWTAQVLREGGLPATPGTAITAGGLLRQIEPLAR